MKGAWLKAFEKAEYRARCDKCGDTVMPEQTPWICGRCWKCFNPLHAPGYWGIWWSDIYANCCANKEWHITTRSWSGRAVEIIERVFRYVSEGEPRKQLYDWICQGIDLANKGRGYGPEDRKQLIEWKRQMRDAIKPLYEAAPKKKRNVSEPGARKKKPKQAPGQLSLF